MNTEEIGRTHRWAGVGLACLDCGEGFWTTKPCPALPRELAPQDPYYPDGVLIDPSNDPEAVAAETIRCGCCLEPVDDQTEACDQTVPPAEWRKGVR